MPCELVQIPEEEKEEKEEMGKRLKSTTSRARVWSVLNVARPEPEARCNACAWAD